MSFECEKSRFEMASHSFIKFTLQSPLLKPAHSSELKIYRFYKCYKFDKILHVKEYIDHLVTV